MEIYQVLMNDHEKVKRMFSDVADAHDEHLVQLAMRQLTEELKLHTELEERLFYPLLKEAEVTRDIIKHSYQEHDDVDNLLASWQTLEVRSQEWRQICDRLRDAVLHHAHEEEQKLFPKARMVISADRAIALGNQALAYKRDHVMH